MSGPMTADELFERYAKILREEPTPVTPEETTVSESAPTKKVDPDTGLVEAKSVLLSFDENTEVYREHIRPYLAHGGRGWVGALCRALDDHMSVTKQLAELEQDYSMLAERSDEMSLRLQEVDAENRALLKIIDHLHKR